MDVVYPRCAGLDVHKDSVVACVRVQEGRRVHRDVQTFGTTTAGLLALGEWLTTHACTHAALEATGVYWKPVWHLLEETVTLVLANAQHIRAVPGRKTDVNDATWIADLLAHGLIRGSFVPPGPIQELRDLTRTRRQLVREITRHTLRLQKTLEDANVKLASVVTDILGVSGRAILEALVAGETDPERLVALTQGRLKAPRPVLMEAVRGRVTAHHRFLLRLHLDQIATLQEAVRRIEARLEDLGRPFRAALDRLSTMPGVSTTVAYVLVAEIGTDMTRFPTAAQLISWAGLCPRLDESAGKRRSTRTRPGAPWLKSVLVQAAWGAIRRKDSYLRAQFLRLKSRRGPRKAIVAVAASMLTAAYHMLRDDAPYRELGADYFTHRDRAKVAHRLIRRLTDLGFQVDVHAAA